MADRWPTETSSVDLTSNSKMRNRAAVNLICTGPHQP
jgi:hypothetical protein